MFSSIQLFSKVRKVKEVKALNRTGTQREQTLNRTGTQREQSGHTQIFELLPVLAIKPLVFRKAYSSVCPLRGNVKSDRHSEKTKWTHTQEQSGHTQIFEL